LPALEAEEGKTMSEPIKVPIGAPDDLMNQPIHRSKGYSPSIPYSMYAKRSFERITGFEMKYPEPPSLFLMMLEGLKFRSEMFRDE
jgi:hypothetical protein